MRYDFKKIEKKWQDIWAKNNYKIWQINNKAKKFYLLDMFPYPSGEGLHVGHVEVYTASDILSRFYRMKGYDVLHPTGFDAFGLPAEVYAVKMKTLPQELVAKNVKKFKEQLKALGFSYDWTREINTTDPDYYKWTQWIFLKLFERGLAYEAEVPVNWCPHCQTVLADEEVVAGCCERCGQPVTRKKMKQWMLKITAYADRLLKDLDLLDWPERVKTMQRNWIGRSEGYELNFKVKGFDEYIKVFTTRLDTIFGATFLVLSPEHPLVLKIAQKNYRREVEEYLYHASQRSDLERQMEKEKTGVYLGALAINPATREEIPIWVSDYVLMNYGTGAIMAVPAHDQRDFDFAQKYHLAIREVISPDGQKQNNLEAPYEGEGILINSGPFNGQKSEEAREKIALYLNARPAVNYKMRDWVFSRQRYWGEPIPIIKCPKCGYVPLKEKDLPLMLPKVKHYEISDTAESPLAKIKDWVNVKCPKCHGPAQRETNTMPQWAGSSWYYLAYILKPKLKTPASEAKKFWDQNLLKHWLPVDLYIGGVEHAVLHLLYARFWHKFLYDLKIVPTPEPFKRLANQGIILGENGEKMSKSLGNVVDPLTIIKKYGADTLRLHEMFMGPLADPKPWSTNGISGVYRFLLRVWQLAQNNGPKAKKEKSAKAKPRIKLTPKERYELEQLRHKTIKKVTEDLEALRFNTAISALMEYSNRLNFVSRLLEKKEWQKHLATLVILLSPFAPHLSEEIWRSVLGHKNSIQKEKWPRASSRYLKESEIAFIIQINGKMRQTLKVKADLDEEAIKKLALAQPKVKKYLAGQRVKKTIFIKNKLINFVI